MNKTLGYVLTKKKVRGPYLNFYFLSRSYVLVIPSKSRVFY